MKNWPRWTIAGVTTLAALCGAARAEPSVITQPDWVQKPDGADFARHYPLKAALTGASGHAVISCDVEVTGRLANCAVAEETPVSMGFGEAAIKISTRFKMRPMLKDGAQVAGGRVTIPLQFRILTRPSEQGDWWNVTNSFWLTAPSLSDMIAAYPATARAQAAGGVVLMYCVLDGAGRTDICRVPTFESAGHAFEKAARGFAKRFSGPAQLPDGLSVINGVALLKFTFDPAMLTTPAPELASPPWAALPLAADVAAVFPAAAAKAGVVNGKVVLACTVQPAGTLGDCKVASEAPAGQGFGQAALGLSSKYRVKLWSEAGEPIIGRPIRATIPFQRSAAPPAPPPKP